MRNLLCIQVWALFSFLTEIFLIAPCCCHYYIQKSSCLCCLWNKQTKKKMNQCTIFCIAHFSLSCWNSAPQEKTIKLYKLTRAWEDFPKAANSIRNKDFLHHFSTGSFSSADPLKKNKASSILCFSCLCLMQPVLSFDLSPAIGFETNSLAHDHGGLTKERLKETGPPSPPPMHSKPLGLSVLWHRWISELSDAPRITH